MTPRFFLGVNPSIPTKKGLINLEFGCKIRILWSIIVSPKNRIWVLLDDLSLVNYLRSIAWLITSKKLFHP